MYPPFLPIFFVPINCNIRNENIARFLSAFLASQTYLICTEPCTQYESSSFERHFCLRLCIHRILILQFHMAARDEGERRRREVRGGDATHPAAGDRAQGLAGPGGALQQAHLPRLPQEARPQHKMPREGTCIGQKGRTPWPKPDISLNCPTFLFPPFSGENRILHHLQ